MSGVIRDADRFGKLLADYTVTRTKRVLDLYSDFEVQIAEANKYFENRAAERQELDLLATYLARRIRLLKLVQGAKKVAAADKIPPADRLSEDVYEITFDIKTEETSLRNQQIIERVLFNEEKVSVVAADFNISTNRVREIVKREHQKMRYWKYRREEEESLPSLGPDVPSVP